MFGGSHCVVAQPLGDDGLDHGIPHVRVVGSHGRRPEGTLCCFADLSMVFTLHGAKETLWNQVIEFHSLYLQAGPVVLREPPAMIEADDANAQLTPGDPLEYWSKRFRPLAQCITIRLLQRIECRVVARRQRTTRKRPAEAGIGNRVSAQEEIEEPSLQSGPCCDWTHFGEVFYQSLGSVVQLRFLSTVMTPDVSRWRFQLLSGTQSV